VLIIKQNLKFFNDAFATLTVNLNSSNQKLFCSKEKKQQHSQTIQNAQEFIETLKNARVFEAGITNKELEKRILDVYETAPEMSYIKEKMKPLIEVKETIDNNGQEIKETKVKISEARTLVDEYKRTTEAYDLIGLYQIITSGGYKGGDLFSLLPYNYHETLSNVFVQALSIFAEEKKGKSGTPMSDNAIKAFRMALGLNMAFRETEVVEGIDMGDMNKYVEERAEIKYNGENYQLPIVVAKNTGRPIITISEVDISGGGFTKSRYVQLTKAEVQKLERQFGFNRTISNDEAVYVKVSTGSKQNINAKDMLVPDIIANNKSLFTVVYKRKDGQFRTQPYNVKIDQAEYAVYNGQVGNAKTQTRRNNQSNFLPLIDTKENEKIIKLYEAITSIIDNKLSNNKLEEAVGEKPIFDNQFCS